MTLPAWTRLIGPGESACSPGRCRRRRAANEPGPSKRRSICSGVTDAVSCRPQERTDAPFAEPPEPQRVRSRGLPPLVLRRCRQPRRAKRSQEAEPRLCLRGQAALLLLRLRRRRVRAHTNSDKLAGQGCNLHQAVSSMPVCAPYRASLMTGKYQSSTGMVINEIRLSPEHECFGTR